MEDALLYARLQFAFTISFHYLFPILTMGLSLIIVLYKLQFLYTGKAIYNRAARFWMKVFALNFVMGVVTGIPMEFQFGTNWARFSELTGSVVGQTLAMEGLFSFFLESTFLGLFLYGEKWLGKRLHFMSALMVMLGSWLSGLLIIATNAWMQHPVGYEILEHGKFVLKDFRALFGNPWLWPVFLHNQAASVLTSSFVVGAVGAFYALSGKREAYSRLFLRTAVVLGVISSVVVAFPSGDWVAKHVAVHQPATFAGMEAIFETEQGSELVLIGQPNMAERRLDNKLAIPKVLSFLTYHEWDFPIKGLDEFPPEEHPTNIPGLYYAYHIMVGLGTLFIGLMLWGVFLYVKRRLLSSRFWLWLLMLMAPLTYIANLAGWYTAELGRQPWLVYGLMRTEAGVSPAVSAGNVLFTFLGFVGLYVLLGLVFAVLLGKIIYQGPEPKKL